ncbi:MAG: metallophosphoesterase [Planctomycetota bacterium]
MRVIQLSDLHLGPRNHGATYKQEANREAWDYARAVAKQLRAIASAPPKTGNSPREPDAPREDELVVVVTGDLTDEGHVNPAELAPAARWLGTLPGRVLCVPGNHDVGNFATARASPTVSERFLAQWESEIGPDRFQHAADGHRLIGLNAMLIGSGLAAEAEQEQWLADELHAAEAAGESVWVFQHAPLFLREPGEIREAREHYWCPDAGPRDRMLRLLDRPAVKGLGHGHVHRRYDQWHGGRVYRACPALSGTHTDADYFPRDAQVDRHDLACWDLTRDGAELSWLPTGLETTTRYVG